MERSELKEYLRADLYRYNGAETSCYFLKALSPSLPAFRYIYLLRHASVFPKKTFRGLLFRALLNHYSCKYGFQLQPNSRIGKGLYIGHRGPVVINGQAEIGDNCTLSHIVTVGQLNRGKRAGCPKIGNKVWIGTGAVLVGKIVIGDNVLIAPNAYITCDVPSNSMAIGNPARCFPIFNQEGNATEGYVNFVFPESNEAMPSDQTRINGAAT
jgi:serine O-acetyltransferase